MYQVVTGAGFGDAWLADEEEEEDRPGFTGCNIENLSNPRASLDQRIDYVFGRGVKHDGVRLLGVRSGERVSGPLFRLWPSDHAGLASKVR